MNKAYLLIYNSTLGTHGEVKETLNSMEKIDKWRTDMLNCFYIISTYSAEELAKDFRTHNPTGRFIISEIPPNSYGWLTPESWYFIQNKTYKPKEKV